MIFAIIPLVYLLLGTIIARAVYVRQYRGIGSESIEARQKLNDMVHGRDCYRNPGGHYYNTSRNCDCGHKTEWRQLMNQVKPMSNPYATLLAWPAIGFHSFLTAPPPMSQSYDPELVARIERELEAEAGINR